MAISALAYCALLLLHYVDDTDALSSLRECWIGSTGAMALAEELKQNVGLTSFEYVSFPCYLAC